MPLLRLFVVLNSALLCIHAQRLLSVTPDLVPCNVAVTTTVAAGGGAGATSVPLTLEYIDGSGAAQSVSLTSVAAGHMTMSVQLPSLPSPVLAAVATSADASDPLQRLPVRYYVPPTVTAIAAPTFTNAGLSPVTVTLDAAGAALPSSSASVLVACATAASLSSASLSSPSLISGVLQGFTGTLKRADGVVIFTYTTAAKIGADARSLTWRSMGLPDSCGVVSVWLTYNEGGHYHLGGELAVTQRPRIKMVSLYPYLIKSSPWMVAHNQARIAVSTSLSAAVDASTYYEESWRLPALPSGKLVDPLFFRQAIEQDNATLIIGAGTQFTATSLEFVANYSNVNVLIFSTLRQVLPPRPNLAFATGRMYEAMFLAGFAAASVSASGKLGFLMSLDQVGSVNFVNAYFLGAQAAYDAGVVPATAARPQLHAWLIGAFSDDWAEQNAAIDLLTRVGIDVLFPVTDNPSPQYECHKRGCFSLGFNDDERLLYGDHVLMSVFFRLAPIYLEFVRRMIVGQAFGPDSYMGGMGAGVDISSLSPVVPLAAQKLVEQRAGLMRLDDSLEEVFCGDLLDSNGTTRLNGTTGATYSGAAAVLGDGGRWCLPASDINSMRWGVQGVQLLGKYTPPPRPVGRAPRAWALSSLLRDGLRALGGIILVLCVIATLVVLLFRRVDVIRYSSPPFLLILNAGAALFAANLLHQSFGAVDDTMCTSSLWSSGIAFALQFGALFAKTYRIHRLFNNRKLKKLRLNVYFVLRVIALILLAEVGLLLALSYLFPRHAVTVTAAGGGPGELITYSHCLVDGNPNLNVQNVLFGLHFILLMWGAYLAVQTRAVPLGFNESLWIGVAIHTCTLCVLLSFIFGVSSGPETTYIVALIQQGIPAASTLVLLYAPKIYAIYGVATGHFDAGGSGGVMGGHMDERGYIVFDIAAWWKGRGKGKGSSSSQEEQGSGHSSQHGGSHSHSQQRRNKVVPAPVDTSAGPSPGNGGGGGGSSGASGRGDARGSGGGVAPMPVNISPHGVADAFATEEIDRIAAGEPAAPPHGTMISGSGTVEGSSFMYGSGGSTSFAYAGRSGGVSGGVSAGVTPAHDRDRRGHGTTVTTAAQQQQQHATVIMTTMGPMPAAEVVHDEEATFGHSGVGVGGGGGGGGGGRPAAVASGAARISHYPDIEEEEGEEEGDEEEGAGGSTTFGGRFMRFLGFGGSSRAVSRSPSSGGMQQSRRHGVQRSGSASAGFGGGGGGGGGGGLNSQNNSDSGGHTNASSHSGSGVHGMISSAPAPAAVAASAAASAASASSSSVSGAREPTPPGPPAPAAAAAAV